MRKSIVIVITPFVVFTWQLVCAEKPKILTDKDLIKEILDRLYYVPHEEMQQILQKVLEDKDLLSNEEVQQIFDDTIQQYRDKESEKKQRK